MEPFNTYVKAGLYAAVAAALIAGNPQIAGFILVAIGARSVILAMALGGSPDLPSATRRRGRVSLVLHFAVGVWFALALAVPVAVGATVTVFAIVMAAGSLGFATGTIGAKASEI